MRRVASIRVAEPTRAAVLCSLSMLERAIEAFGSNPTEGIGRCAKQSLYETVAPFVDSGQRPRTHYVATIFGSHI